ncbi:hypothetical protein Tco_1206413, partial [Tanacetum coccineum]
MSLVVQKLKIALQFQDPVSFNFSDSLEIIKAADTSLTYKGFLVNGGKTPSVENSLRGSEEPQAPARKSVTESDSMPKTSLIDRQH